jgi:tetratricopeptide repeat protein
MHRPLYLLGFGYLAICGVVVVRHHVPRPAATTPEHPTARVPRGTAQEWFSGIKPYCNAVEVELAIRGRPAPATLDGQGYSAACYALGGKIDLARATLDRLPAPERAQAAAIVFGVAHPVADAGDDRSAGPIMELVLDYIPSHYMALYHAGMSEYALGQPALARTHLESFLSFYHANDGWTQNARDVLARLR